MNLNKLISVTSTIKAIDRAKSQGNLDLTIPFIFDMYAYYIDFTDGKSAFEEENVILVNEIDYLKYKYPNIICTYKSELSDSITVYLDGDIISSGSLVAPVVTDFTTTTISQETLFGTGALYSIYQFNSVDFLANYTDDNDNIPYYVKFYRDSLDSGGLKYNSTATTGSVYGESANALTILFSEIADWSYYTNSSVLYSHDILFELHDKQGNNIVESNIGTITIDREAVGNQPATIGDSALKIGNRLTTTLTLAMFTSGLTPPYNDPEGDLVDAIRIDEISTANVGAFQYNNIDVTEGQIITREDIDLGLFTHVGPDVNTIETDAINFSVRDEGSLIWVN